MLVKKTGDLLGKGFQLAYFLVPDRTSALQILSAAMSKLAVQRSREIKRAYWRDKYLKRKITRITRDDGDLLQWMIYSEAEEYERRQEQGGEQTARDMVVRYIKYLVQLTTAMSSFYVNVGLHRLLHNYSTSEVQKVYESVTQHYPGDQEYRKVKGMLMNRLQMRFNDFIRTCTAHYGELRFEVSEEQDSWAELVDRCLRAFTPWSTAQTCQLLANLDPDAGIPPFPLSGEGGGASVDQDTVEIQRCHAFIEPSCYGWLTKRFRLDPPHTRLAVPRFLLKHRMDGQKNTGNGSGTAPDLTEEERKGIMDRLTAESARRERISPKFLSIVADGRECAQLDLGRRRNAHFEIQAGARLIEIWAEDQGEKILLATHWIAYTQCHGIAPSTASVDLGKGREILLQVVPAPTTTDELGNALILLKWQLVSRWAAWRNRVRHPPMWFRNVPKYALAPLLFLAIGGIVGAVKYSRELLRQQAASRRLGKELAEEIAARAALEYTLQIEHGVSTQSYVLVPNDLLIRGQQGTKEPVITLSSHTPLVVLELPVGRGSGESYRVVLKPFLDDHEILTENLPKSIPMRGDETVKFVLPVSFVEDGRHYVVTLNSIRPSGRMEEIRKFTFYVKKNK